MKDWQSQAHVKWECKYHVVIHPKYRRKVLYGRLRDKHGPGRVSRDKKGNKVISGPVQPGDKST